MVMGASNHPSLKILLIENDSNDRELTGMALRHAAPNATIHTISSGSEAIAYLMGEGKYSDRTSYPYPSFILTDLNMPGIDGFDVLYHLKTNPAWAVIPTVVLSTSNDPDDIQTAYLLGASSYLVKPASFHELSNLIDTFIDYWSLCLVPQVDASGKHLHVRQNKLGARFPQSLQLIQARVKPRPHPEG